MNRSLSSQWSASLVKILKMLGVRHVAISPGYRNSSLVQAFTSDDQLSCYSFIDERTSAFFALGSAKATGVPAVIVSTSGTAVANFFPAIVEASLSSTPMIIITADRPRELIGIGENQTIDQHKIFGNFVRSFVDLGLPKKNLNNLKKIVVNIYRLSAGLDQSASSPGPVHINCPYDMPILDLLDPLKIDSDIDDSPEVSLPKINAIKPGPKPLIVCGTMHAFYNYKNIIELAKHWSAPIFADPTSQVKFSSSSSLIIGNYDLMLRNVSVEPSRIVRFGNKPTSKSLNNLLNKFKDRVVTVSKYKQFNDDTDIYIQSSNRKFCLAQISGTDKNSNKFWLESITKNSRKTKAILDKHRNHNVTEPLIYSDIVNILCKGDSLFIGNSMPIRDMDSYTAPSNINIKVLSNRGASGIDGLIASACGMSVESNQKNVLVLGDVSFAHDIGSLVDASRLNIDLTIVIVNNGGGNIFNQLPIEEHVKKSYKKFWLTNPNLDTESICKAFKYNYIKTDNINDFKEKFSHALSLKGLKVVEILCDVKNDNRFRKNVLKELSSF